ncbi:MAG: hypothetical protein K2J84_05940 [Bacteroidaceae bacterium]|nr:hypothetical protein [Bacteroidaceae bacterium]
MIEVTNIWDELCNMCILILEGLSHVTGLSYGFLNIMLFVILGPSATLLFMTSALTLLVNAEIRKSQRIFATILFAMGLLVVLMIALLVIRGFLASW